MLTINYEQEDASGSASSVLILVATDCDSLCACKILTALLESDFIKFTVKPVAGPDDLTTVDSELIQDNDELKSILMINCGGGVDLSDYFTLAEGVVVYVIDSHRPYSASNIVTFANVVILDDGIDKKKIDDLKLPVAEENEENGENEQDEEEERISLSRKEKKSKEMLHRCIYVGKTTYFGMSASSLMYRVAISLRKESLDDLLWFGIVGMSDQLVHERIPHEEYLEEVKYFGTIVKDKYLGEDEDNGASNTLDTISTLDEFMLYRHWTLYDSMLYSRYIASQLGIWKSDGVKKLDTLLAKMGLPLDECKQPYSAMSVENKKQMKSALAKYAPQFGLDHIKFQSFQRQIGFKEQQSATDTVYAITALLESDSATPEGEVPWETNFWSAYDALSTRKVELLHKGIQKAVEHHRAIVRQGLSMIEKKSITITGPFRYSIVPEGPDLHYFTHPLALSRLALFLIETQVMSMKKQHKPIVLAALKEKTSTYLTVGVSGSSFTDQDTKNEFASHFKNAAKKISARITLNSFDRSVVEVLMNDMPRFMEQLHIGLNQEKS